MQSIEFISTRIIHMCFASFSGLLLYERYDLAKRPRMIAFAHWETFALSDMHTDKQREEKTQKIQRTRFCRINNNNRDKKSEHTQKQTSENEQKRL